tara:strand:- start:11418 stop:11729 length:312 start_codon:yes stop_codon:yes gene_type:complete
MLDLALVKQHLRVLHSREDTLIQSYVDTALCEFESYTERKLYLDQDELDADTTAPTYTAILDSKITNGALLLIGYLYSVRDMDASMPRATERLWNSYRVIRIA